MTTDSAVPSRKPASPALDDHGRVEYRVLSVRMIVVWALFVLLTGAAMAVWMLLAYTGGDTEANRVQLDAIRTAGTVVVGAGGAAALLLAARRQRTAEIALRQKERDQADVAQSYALQKRIADETRAHQVQVAADARVDATERRITDLYNKAAEQLGSDRAPVRLASLYALDVWRRARQISDRPSLTFTVPIFGCLMIHPQNILGSKPLKMKKRAKNEFRSSKFAVLFRKFCVTI